MAGVVVQFLGTGDAVGSGARFHTCFHVIGPGVQLLVDCGASSVTSMKRHGVGADEIDAILLSHLHGDHFGGIPFLLLDARFVARRARPLVIAGPPGSEARVTQVTRLMFPDFLERTLDFPIEFVELAAGRATSLGPVTVTPAEVQHPSGAPSYGLRLALAGRTIAYSGDTEWTDALFSIARGADLFICECYAYDRPVPWHLDYATLVERRPEFDCRRMVLTHMSDPMLKRLDQLAIETACDGMRIEI